MIDVQVGQRFARRLHGLQLFEVAGVNEHCVVIRWPTTSFEFPESLQTLNFREFKELLNLSSPASEAEWFEVFKHNTVIGIEGNLIEDRNNFYSK